LPTIENITCFNGSAWKTSFNWNETVTICQANATDPNDDPVNVTFTGYEGVSDYDDSYDTDDLWFNITNSSVQSGIFTIDVPPNKQFVNYSGNWTILVTASDGSYQTQSSISWYIPWGTISATLDVPSGDVSVVNGTSFTANVTITCNEYECGNVTAYFDPV